MRHFSQAFLVGLLFVALSFSGPARAEIIDRVTAIVDGDIITMSDLKTRARPSVNQMKQQISDPLQRPVAETRVYREVLEAMINDRLVQKVAQDLHVTCTNQEVDSAVMQIATSNKVTVAEIKAQVAALGMTENDYRAEIRRQIVMGKVIQLRVRPRMKVRPGATEKELYEAMEAEQKKWLEELREQHFVDVRL